MLLLRSLLRVLPPGSHLTLASVACRQLYLGFNDNGPKEGRR
jgi:hypothetical protein